LHVSEGGAETDNVGMQWLTVANGAGAVMPDGTQYADYANPHNYAVGNCGHWIDNAAWVAEDPAVLLNCVDGLQGEYGVTWNQGYTGYTSNQLVTLPRVTTETGWGSTNLPNNFTRSDGRVILSETNLGKLYMNLYLDAYKRGW